MRSLLLVAALLVSNSTFAGPAVDSYLSGIASMDKVMFQILSDYRDRINTACSRDVSIPELRALTLSSQYAKLSATLSNTSAPVSEYNSILTSISCAEFMR